MQAYSVYGPKLVNWKERIIVICNKAKIDDNKTLLALNRALTVIGQLR